MLSLIIPVFNEEWAVEETMREAHRVFSDAGEPFEVIVVDDGSTDRTSVLLDRMSLPSLRILRHPVNRGNGAAILTGVSNSKGDVIATVDADGTYPLDEFPALYTYFQRTDADMIVGVRKRQGTSCPLSHWIAKMFLRFFASMMVGRFIPDLNSGMRIVRRELVEQFTDFYPERFSFHIVLTVAALLTGGKVRWVPVPYTRRIGLSKLSSGAYGYYNFFKFLFLIAFICLRVRLRCSNDRINKRPHSHAKCP